jgi:hypothetical protein
MTTPEPSRRWYRLTPGRLLVVLLAVEGILWLANWLRWLPKGYGVLIAVASVGVFVLVMLLWFLGALVFRWRFQYSILSLLGLMVAVALPFAWLETEMKQAKTQHGVMEVFRRFPTRVMYDCDREGRAMALPGSRWLRRLLGDDFFGNVVDVCVECDETFTDADMVHVGSLPKLEALRLAGAGITDAGLEHLKGLARLQRLELYDTNITDVGLRHLNGLTQLQHLWLGDTKVTDAGVKKLQQALPNCEIRR